MKRYMNKKELAIANISDAELVKYYYMPDGEMGLLIINGSKVFNLASGEKYFDDLEQAALRVYSSCADAASDELTRRILEKRSAAAQSPIFGKYEGIEGTYEKHLPFEKDTLKTFLNIIEYCLEMIYDRLGSAAEFPAELKGYRRNYSLNFRLDNERKAVPFSYLSYGDRYEMLFGNFLEISDTIKLSIKYTFGMISVTADVRCKKHIRTENTFDILHKTETLRIFDEAELVYNSSKPIPSTPSDIPKEIKPITDSDRSEVLQLPFGTAFHNDSDKKTEMIICQKSENDASAFLFHCQREYPTDEKSVVSDSMTAVHEIFYGDGKMNICTHFLPTGSFSKGIYKQNYENRYFYRCIDDIGGKGNGS